MGEGRITADRAARLGLLGLLASGGLALVAGATALSVGSFAAAGAAAQLVAALPVWLAIFLGLLYRHRAEAERLEAQRLATLASEGRQTLFAEQRQVTGDAQLTLERFQRVGHLALALVTAFVELGVAYGLLAVFPGPEPAGSLPGAAILCGAAFGLLLLGRYAFALAARGTSAFAAGGRRATYGALATLVAGLLLAVMQTFEVPGLDRVGYAFAAVEGLLGVEVLVLIVLEAYRPRRKGEELRPAYDSRLLGLLAAPSEIARTIARAVDYQFGFGLSQTWLYRFLARWVAPLAGFAGLAYWLLSAFVVVHAHEQAVLYHLGDRRPEALRPGLHLKLPWPIQTAEVYGVRRVQVIVTGHAHGQPEHDEDEHEHGHGHEHDEDEPAEEEGARDPVLLWTEAHVGDEEDLVLIARRARAGDAPGDDEDARRQAAPVNLLAASATVHYRVRDLMEHVDRVGEPRALLRALVEREISLVLSSADLDALLQERGARGAELAERVQAACEAHGLGVEVLSAMLTDLHPPVEVGEAFESVSRARQSSRAEVLAAEADAAKTVPAGRARAAAIRARARSEAATKVALARADADRFGGLMALDRAAPGVFRSARLLEELIAGTEDSRKIVILAGDEEVLTDLNLEDRVRAEQLDLGQEFDPDLAPPSSGGAEGE